MIFCNQQLWSIVDSLWSVKTIWMMQNGDSGAC